MAPRKKVVEEKSPKRKAVRTTIALKKEIIARYESGVKLKNVAQEFKMARTTIHSILKKKEAIKMADVAKGVKILCNKRTPTFDHMENILLMWITERQMAGGRLTESIICEKAKIIYYEIQQKTPGDTLKFSASRGWYEKFKKRTGVHWVVKQGEEAGSNTEDAKTFVEDFKKFVNADGYVPQQVFNCGETGLFWKKLPHRTYITEEELALPGARPTKDRMSLMLCTNASGDCKIKPLMVHVLENPRAFKRNNVQKSELNVMWRANSKGCISRQFFLEWIHEVFAPCVKNYLENRKLPLKVLLVLDHTPAHPPGLHDVMIEGRSFISIKYLPPNTSLLIQPMNHQVMVCFKKLYTRALFQRCYDVTTQTELTLRDFWKNHFNILHAVKMIQKTWTDLSPGIIITGWCKLWRGSMTEKDINGFVAQAIDDIIAMSKAMDLEVSIEDLERLIDEHKKELTADELLQLHKEQEAEVTEEVALAEEGANRGSIPTPELKDMLDGWSKTHNLIKKWHINPALANQNINAFNANVVEYFKKVMESRQKQAAADKLLPKPAPAETSAFVPPEWSYMMYARPGVIAPNVIDYQSEGSWYESR